MATHTNHPSILEHGLADGCDRCAEHARDLICLDTPNLLQLQDRVQKRLDARSTNEATAMDNMAHVLRVVKRLGTSCWICGAKALPEYTFCSDACATYHSPRGATG